MKLRRLVAAAAMALAGAGFAVALWPLHVQGATGTALWPHYGDFGWYSYQPLNGPVTIAELRRAGVHVPQDDVDHRRRIAGSLIAAGVIAGVSVLRDGRRAATGCGAG